MDARGLLEILTGVLHGFSSPKSNCTSVRAGGRLIMHRCVASVIFSELTSQMEDGMNKLGCFEATPVGLTSLDKDQIHRCSLDH
jgi:hypothetical protein